MKNSDKPPTVVISPFGFLIITKESLITYKKDHHTNTHLRSHQVGKQARDYFRRNRFRKNG